VPLQADPTKAKRKPQNEKLQYVSCRPYSTTARGTSAFELYYTPKRKALTQMRQHLLGAMTCRERSAPPAMSGHLFPGALTPRARPLPECLLAAGRHLRLIRLQALQHRLAIRGGFWMVAQGRPVVPAGRPHRPAKRCAKVVDPPYAGRRQFRFVGLQALHDPAATGWDIGAEGSNLFGAREFLGAHSRWQHSAQQTTRDCSRQEEPSKHCHGHVSLSAHWVLCPVDDRQRHGLNFAFVRSATTASAYVSGARYFWATR
jgi:hypothetical protein